MLSSIICSHPTISPLRMPSFLSCSMLFISLLNFSEFSKLFSLPLLFKRPPNSLCIAHSRAHFSAITLPVLLTVDCFFLWKLRFFRISWPDPTSLSLCKFFFLLDCEKCLVPPPSFYLYYLIGFFSPDLSQNVVHISTPFLLGKWCSIFHNSCTKWTSETHGVPKVSFLSSSSDWLLLSLFITVILTGFKLNFSDSWWHWAFSHALITLY